MLLLLLLLLSSLSVAAALRAAGLLHPSPHLCRFDNETGKLSFTGDVTDVPSPNFVCAFQPHRNNRKNHARL